MENENPEYLVWLFTGHRTKPETKNNQPLFLKTALPSQ